MARLRRLTTALTAVLLAGPALPVSSASAVTSASTITSVVAGATDVRPATAPSPSPESRFIPPTDCTAQVGMPQQGPLPGYRVPDAAYGHVCVGVTPTPLAPAGFRGDYRVDAFTDRALRGRYEDCRAAGPCAADAQLDDYRPQTFRSTGSVVPFGKVDPYAATLDLSTIRRPGFFGRAPFAEPIASAEQRTTTVELAVPAERYDIEHGHPEAVRLRGWYLAGRGVADRRGRRQRSLVVLIGGRTVETTATQDPQDPLYVRTPTGGWANATYPRPGSLTESWGGPAWRSYLRALNEDGFDVLTFDKRGHGISGGRTPDNTFQQGLDMLRAVDALRTGRGLRTLGPDGVTRTGRTAARAVVPPRERARMPILLGGSSQGSYTTQWAMNANQHRWCEVDQRGGGPCHRPWGIPNVKGAILLASLPGFPRSEPEQAALEGARRERLGLVRYPSSEPLARIGDWPNVFYGKGLHDDVAGPLGTFDAYRRSRTSGRELLLVRGPHSEIAWGEPLIRLVQQRLVSFATRSVAGRPARQRGFADLRQAVAASPPLHAPTTSSTPLP